MTTKQLRILAAIAVAAAVMFGAWTVWSITRPTVFRPVDTSGAPVYASPTTTAVKVPYEIARARLVLHEMFPNRIPSDGAADALGLFACAYLQHVGGDPASFVANVTDGMEAEYPGFRARAAAIYEVVIPAYCPR